MSPLAVYGVAFTAALFLSLGLTPLVRRVALRRGCVAVPKANRWHRKPTALLGGVGIFLAVSLAWGGCALFLGKGTAVGPLLPVALGGLAMFLLGLTDDLRDIKPQHKLVGQIIVASLVVLFGFQLEWFVSRTGNLMVSIFWIVGITNAFNLLDNMDGLSAGTALIAGAFFFLNQVFPGGVGETPVPALLLLAIFLGAVLGFLFYNVHPASIFMGDSGSLLLGFVLAALATGGSGLLAAKKSGPLVSVLAIPVFVLFIPILDTAFVSLMRKFFRRPLSQGGQDHSSHRLVAIGFSERTAVAAMYGFAIASGLLAMALGRLPLAISLVLAAAYLLVVLFFWLRLAGVKVYEEESILADRRIRRLTPLLLDVTYKKRLFEVLLDLVLVSLAYWSSYLIRFEGGAYEQNFETFFKSLPIVLACQIFSFYLLGVYRGIWLYVGMRDVMTYARAVVLGTVLSVLVNLVAYRFMGFSRTLFVIFGLLLFLFVVCSRFSFRLIGELTMNNAPSEGRRVLIYGAGAGGQIVAQEIEKNPNLGMAIAGFLDDDLRKQGCNFLGYPVFGGRAMLPEMVHRHGVRELVVSFRNVDKALKEDLKRTCDALGVGLRRLHISLD